MRFIADVASRMGVMGELLLFFSKNKWWWLTPMVGLLLLFSALMIFGQISAIAPFIYTLF
jgi:hypothetical protein